MLWAGAMLVAAVGVTVGAEVSQRACYHHPTAGRSLYDFTETDLQEGRNISLSDYRGKVLLVVNVATYWGLTIQYLAMNVLQESFSGFEVLGFPCNQFGGQEPGATGLEILNGVKNVRPGNGFEPNFTLFSKVEVNGKNEHPIFEYLKSFCPSTRESFVPPEYLHYDPIKNSDIRWNWEKFLITKSGKPYMRYDPKTKPDQLRNDILFLLQQEA